MAVPALVIGLGGTGQWVLTYLKKDLLETYNKIPTGVRLRAFDTVKIARAQAGGDADEAQKGRVEERAVAGVKLEPGEYIHIGGYVRDYIREIAQDEEDERFPHIRSWFQANYYLDNLPDQQFNLDEGAGQFRQFGRLSIFYDLRAATIAKVYGQLQDTVQQIQRDTNTQNLYVFVIGSLAGGTGAGMFVDVAHLVRLIAKEQAKIQVNVRGFLVLPDAFGALPAASVIKRGMNARAFAAMRENKRFSINFDWALGYPMHYQALTPGRQPDPVLRGAIKGQLFDHLYYLDGHRQNFPLFSIPLEHGVAPTISDMISGVLDSRSSGAFEEHTRNLQAVLAARGDTRRIPYYGSIGTYSIIFPIYHIVEGYAHRLGLEALQQLLQPAATDDRTGIPTRLAGNRNREAGEGYSGADAARAFLTSGAIVDPKDPTQAVDNTLLSADLVDIAERFTPQDASIVDQLASRSLVEWDRVFAPTGQSEDVLNAKARAEAVLRVRLVDEVPPSKDVKPKEQPSDGVFRIENGVRSHKNIYLGAEQPESGQRVGGKYREALNEYAAVHRGRMQRMLDFKMREILNGRSTTDPLLAKGGKLGHLQEFLNALAEYLDRSYQVMTRVMERRRGQNYGRMQAIFSAQNALGDMRAAKDDTRPIIGKAHKTQELYLEMEQNLIDIHKLEIVEQVVADTIRQMAEMVATAHESVDNWVKTLGVGQGSLYGVLLSGRQLVDANRNKDADVESRLVLGAHKAGRQEDKEYGDFRKYEDERYQHYVHEGQVSQVAAVLSDLNWQVEVSQQRGKPVFRVGLTVTTHDGDRSSGVLSDNASSTNSRIFLNRSREAFTQVRNDESVLGYLMYAYKADAGGAEKLAELIHARSGPLLRHEGTGPIPANYLRVSFGTEGGQTDYLRSMLLKLASLSSISEPDRFAKLVNSEDRFTCTLVHSIDLVELDTMGAFNNSLGEYMAYRGEAGVQTTQRTILHCFPAEVNAVQMEERLPELNQKVRMLHDDIVLQLEKRDNMRFFLFCYAYELIKIHAFDENGVGKECYRLQWTPVNARDTGEVWLTRPKADEEPSFLEALMTFNYEGKDVGHAEGYFKAIEYGAVQESLEMRQREEMKERRAAGTLGDSAPALRGLLEEQKVSEEDPAWILIARHDLMAELEAQFAGALPGIGNQLKDKPALQVDYDLASVFVLTLRDEQEKLKRRIRGRSRDPQPAPTPQPKPRDADSSRSIWRRS